MLKHWNILSLLNFVSGSFLVLCLLVPNVKFYFLLSIVFVFVLFWITRSWEKVVIYGFLPLSLYYVGQLYVFRVIQPEELNHPLYPDGRSLYFKFTPILVFGIAMILSWLWQLIVYRLETNWLILVLLAIILLNLFSGLESRVLPWWFELGNSIGNLAVVIWVWWGQNFLKKLNISERENFFEYIANFLKISLLIESILIIVQGIKSSGLGLVVEQSSVLPYSGSGGDAGGWLNRPIGIWAHANLAAYYILFQLLAWILIKIRSNANLKNFLQKWLVIPLTALIWLQSRSIFLVMFLLAGWAIYFYKKDIVLMIRKIEFSGIKKWLAIGVISFFVVVTTNRFWSSVTSFGIYSGWDTRSRLVSVAVKLIEHHFWFGVGNGNFIPMAFREDMTKTMKAFPESVHNGWLLILAEQGIFSFILWLVFIFLFIRKWILLTQKNKNLRWLLLVGLVGQLVFIMYFQPFTDILMMEIIIGMLLLINYEKR